MADKNVQIKNLNGDLLFPKTKGSLVYNNNNEALGGVEAGAQVNLIEKIQLNGVDLSILTGKTVNIELPAADAYSLAKDSTPESGYVATYHLTKNGSNVGTAINIPKDFLVKSASMGICQTAGVPACTPALNVDDPYLDFVINTKDASRVKATGTYVEGTTYYVSATGDETVDTSSFTPGVTPVSDYWVDEPDSHIYINVKGLVDIYTAGNGLDLTNNQFSVDTTDTSIVDTAPTQNSTKFVQSGGVYTALAGKQDTIDATHMLDADLVDDSTSTNKFVTASDKTTWSGKQDAITSTNKLSADLVEAGSTNAVLTLTEKAELIIYQELA